MKSFYNKILIPIDGSEHADLAFRHALGLAANREIEIVLLNCFEELPATIGGEARSALIGEMEAQAHKLLEPYVKIAKDAGHSCKTLVRGGPAARTIVHTANDEKCDLIAMGSRGLSDFSGMLMGSVSHRVLSLAKQPVLIVR